MRHVNNKGFTLVELLAIIVITALVLGIGIYSVTKLIGNSKKEANTIGTNSIKDAASVYSDEDSNRWIEPYGDNYSYFCVTVEELINKGIIKKNANLPDNIDGSTYVSIKKNKVTLVKGEAVILGKNTEDKSTEYQVCTGTDIKSENFDAPSLGDSSSYTDSLSIPFTDGEADSGIKDRWCQYNTDSSIKEGENVIILDSGDKSCNIDNLKNNTNYYVRVCMTTNGGSRACSGTKGYKTKDFTSPDISYSGVSANIKYIDDGINDGKAEHYFKSNVSASSSDVYECDDNFNCSNTSSNDINKDKWYKLNGTNISIDYSNSDGINDGEITAKISDGSNSMEVNSEFTLYKVVFKVGNADSIDGKTNDITKRCLAKKGAGCKMTSPSISKYCYSGMGWNTSNNADSSIWASKGENVVSNSGTYYPTNGSVTNYIIRYDANGGSGAPSSQTKVCGVNLKLSSDKPSRVNYNFLGWSTSSDGSVSYSSGDTYSSNSSITLYAVWSYRWYCSYTGLRYDSYSAAESACTVSRKVTTSKTSSTTYTYSCPSGYTCSGNTCTSSSTCSKTVNGTVTTKYYCSHNSSYQNSSTCSYSGTETAYVDLKCSNKSQNCKTSSYDCSKAFDKCSDGYETCPSSWCTTSKCKKNLGPATKTYKVTKQTCTFRTYTCSKNPTTRDVNTYLCSCPSGTTHLGYYGNNAGCTYKSGSRGRYVKCRYYDCPSGYTKSGSGANSTCYKANQSSCPSGYTASREYKFYSSQTNSSTCSKGSSFTCNSSKSGSSYVSSCESTYTCSSGRVATGTTSCYVYLDNYNGCSKGTVSGGKCVLTNQSSCPDSSWTKKKNESCSNTGTYTANGYSGCKSVSSGDFSCSSSGSSCSVSGYSISRSLTSTSGSLIGSSCTSDKSDGATGTYGLTCSKTGDMRYYCSITGSYTASKPSCKTTKTANLIKTPHTTSSCPSGYTEDSSGSCYRYVDYTYDIS